jgi:hypothetical protein
MTTIELEKIADAYLEMTPESFDAWLQEREATDRNCAAVLSALLAGTLTEQWARDHASPQTR